LKPALQRFAERTLPGEMRGGGSFGVPSDGVEPFVGGDEEGAVGGDGGGVDGAVEVDFVNHFFFFRGGEDGQVALFVAEIHLAGGEEG